MPAFHFCFASFPIHLLFSDGHASPSESTSGGAGGSDWPPDATHSAGGASSAGVQQQPTSRLRRSAAVAAVAAFAAAEEGWDDAAGEVETHSTKASAAAAAAAQQAAKRAKKKMVGGTDKTLHGDARRAAADAEFRRLEQQVSWKVVVMTWHVGASVGGQAVASRLLLWIKLYRDLKEVRWRRRRWWECQTRGRSAGRVKCPEQ
jgi:hypothetical protein